WPRAYVFRGVIRMSRSCSEALNDFDAALRKDRKLAWGYAAKAWVRATCQDEKWRNGAEALQLAQTALSLEDHWKLHDVLAAAYAESGRYDDSVRELKLAEDKLGPDASHNAWHSSLRARLTLYEARQPYREPTAEPAAAGEWLASLN